MGLQGHMVALVLVFQGTFIQFSIVAVPIYILTDSVGWGGVLFSPHLLRQLFVDFLMIAILTGVR